MLSPPWRPREYSPGRRGIYPTNFMRGTAVLGLANSDTNNGLNGHSQDLKTILHAKVLDQIDLEKMNSLDEETVREQVRQLTRDLLQRDRTPLTLIEREQLVGEILDELFGLGPLEPLLGDPTVSDILVNGGQEVYIERHGVLHRTSVTFNDDKHL